MSVGLVPPRPPVHLNRRRIRSQVRDGELAPGAAGGFSARGELGTFMILMRPGAIGEKKGAGIGDIQGFRSEPAVAANGGRDAGFSEFTLSARPLLSVAFAC